MISMNRWSPLNIDHHFLVVKTRQFMWRSNHQQQSRFLSLTNQTQIINVWSIHPQTSPKCRSVLCIICIYIYMYAAYIYNILYIYYIYYMYIYVCIYIYVFIYKPFLIPTGYLAGERIWTQPAQLQQITGVSQNSCT
jgi:hypothetical protein